MTDRPRPVCHRNGDVSVAGTVIGKVTRHVVPVGPVRPNGTRRLGVEWGAWNADGGFICRSSRKAHAVSDVAVHDRYNRPSGGNAGREA